MASDRTQPVRACEALATLVHLCGASARLEILTLLAEGALDVQTIARSLELDPSAISHHLHDLREGGLVSARHDKRRRVYRLGPLVAATHRNGTLSLVVGVSEGPRLALFIPAPHTGGHQPTRSRSRAAGTCSVTSPSDQTTRTSVSRSPSSIQE